VLDVLQSCLEDLYGLEPRYSVNDFLITDRVLAAALGGAKRPIEEELLIDQGEGEAAVSLFLNAQLLDRLAKNDPTSQLNHDNLADFWKVFEGVSHFTYFVHRAANDRCVSRLEMELQAEVDKFVVTTLLLRKQGETLPENLHACLFEWPRFDSELTADEYERYERANHYASRYCRRLWPDLNRRQWPDGMRRELRHFYRLPQPEKIGHIQSSR